MTLRRYAYGALLAAGNSYDYLHGHGFSQLTVRTVMVRKDGLGTQFCTVCTNFVLWLRPIPPT